MPSPPRRSAKRPAGPEVRGKLERYDRWSGLRRGDAVEVAELGQRGASYAFHAFVVNTETKEAWVEVVGGVGGDRKLRSFDPSRIHPGGGLKGPSLVQAPRLDL